LFLFHQVYLTLLLVKPSIVFFHLASLLKALTYGGVLSPHFLFVYCSMPLLLQSKL